mgnify:CR=1 FL=1
MLLNIPELLLLMLGFFVIATLYSSVGFGGGSSYLALLALVFVSFFAIRSIALICNLVVVSGSCYLYWKNGHLDFKKFLPFIITSIPLAFIGAIWALYLTGTTISVVVFIGLIMLAGIVVNNAIVLIDLIKQLMLQGVDKTTAIIEAGQSRLRPIIMTTMTTVLGLMPMVITIGGSSAGSEIRAPMAITVMGGLLVSTFLTLVVIPVLFSLMTKERQDG